MLKLAKQECEEALASFPSVEIYCQMTLISADLGEDYLKLAEYFEYAYRLSSESQNQFYDTALCLLAHGKPKYANAIFSFICEHYPDCYSARQAQLWLLCLMVRENLKHPLQDFQKSTPVLDALYQEVLAASPMNDLGMITIKGIIEDLKVQIVAHQGWETSHNVSVLPSIKDRLTSYCHISPASLPFLQARDTINS